MKSSRPAGLPAGPGEAKTAYFDIDMSPPRKNQDAQPLGVLARKLQEVPPAALLSLQERSGAHHFSAERLPAVTLRWHLPVGEAKEVLKLRRPMPTGRLWTTRQRGNAGAVRSHALAHRATAPHSTLSSARRNSAAGVLSDPYCDIDCAW